mmetsp:Transcript_2174/g.5769  ORF Transcript_2174/g.5769 Transcript_2174/m.5769 type:complete len:175 (+) Transcript_2174:257-781(+)
MARDRVDDPRVSSYRLQSRPAPLRGLMPRMRRFARAGRSDRTGVAARLRFVPSPDDAGSIFGAHRVGTSPEDIAGTETPTAWFYWAVSVRRRMILGDRRGCTPPGRLNRMKSTSVLPVGRHHFEENAAEKFLSRSSRASRNPSFRGRRSARSAIWVLRDAAESAPKLQTGVNPR